MCLLVTGQSYDYSIILFDLAGGCSAFGHACFGGHGKRFDSDMSEQSSERGGASEQSFQDELSRNEQLLLLAGGLGLKSRERERERERDRGDRDRNPLLFGGATAGSGGVPVPSTPVTYQSLIKALLECQSIKQIYLAQAFAKVTHSHTLTYLIPS